MNAPTLRFKDFNGKWSANTLKEITIGLEYGMNAAAKSFDGENQYIRITDIDDNSRRYILENPVSPEGKLSDNYLLEEGDILFARTGASTGKSYLYKVTDGKMYFAGFLIRARLNKDVVSKFIYLQTLTKRFNDWVKIMSMRSGQPGINAKEYGEFTIQLTSHDEQLKIADFFTLLDQRIEKQREKIKLLKTQKKGLMQKIFNQELRFKDNNGQEYPEWEYEHLNKLGDFGKSYAYARSVEGEGEYRYIHYGDIHSSYPTVCENITFPMITNEQEHECLLDGDIVFADASEDYADLGKAVLIKDINEQRIIAGLHTHKFTPNNRLDSLYFIYFTQTKEYREFIRKMGTGVSVLGISKTNLSKLEVPLPSLIEQKKISKPIYILDKKIQHEQIKIATLQSQKQAFMQQMFI
ncbi:restriction endonuclease subunit S [Peribacillus frigoritolerans]|uniref:restriction endonuclease subunit S n=1 Tax=Peribacillus frigoritolerans TaxID=450367 RepID=UPI00203B2F5C|nr:restriction endonuclease subunit S [Peribacillus frigoritolerans]MCM3169448.1 restriction endonuclease subunit S [Peribacillus frigoritolerans]